MAAAPAVPEQRIPDGEEEEEYESDDYDVEDDEEDADYQGDDVDEEEEDDEVDEGDEEEGRKSLTALLVADPNQSAQVDEEEDEGYAPPGVTDPADEPIDGNACVPTGDTSDTKGANNAVPPAVAAVGLKRKTSGDEDDEEDEDDEDESDAKKLKA
ncbi:hypothetical protein ACEPAI_251 [Sanghuangporus weigelae]